jgi:alpha-glucoside transport system permease protein
MQARLDQPAQGQQAFDITQFAISAVLIVITFIGLYAGFVFLRDSTADRIFIAIVAIVWGVGGIAALYFVFNNMVEKLPGNWMSRLQPFIFVGPAVVLLAWYLAVPTIRTLALSFFDRTSTNFVGLENYIAVFSQRQMVEAWTNNLLWIVVGTALVVIFGLLIAILSDRSVFENAAKSLIFMPMAISMVGAGVIWKFVYDSNPNIGLLNAVVTGFGGEAQPWLTLVQPWNNVFLIIVVVWLQTGYAMVLISAAIKGIPEELLEAARVDGANEVQIFVRIILPSIAPTLVTVVTTVVIFMLKIFDVVMVMTGGQFGTEVVGVRFYREAFTAGNSGFASAIAIVLLIAVIPVMIYNLRQFSQRQTF